MLASVHMGVRPRKAKTTGIDHSRKSTCSRRLPIRSPLPTEIRHYHPFLRLSNGRLRTLPTRFPFPSPVMVVSTAGGKQPTGFDNSGDNSGHLLSRVLLSRPRTRSSSGLGRGFGGRRRPELSLIHLTHFASSAKPSALWKLITSNYETRVCAY
jgi:hypothetical protein